MFTRLADIFAVFIVLGDFADAHIGVDVETEQQRGQQRDVGLQVALARFQELWRFDPGIPPPTSEPQISCSA